MIDDYTTNSHDLTYIFLLKVARRYFFSFGVKGLMVLCTYCASVFQLQQEEEEMLRKRAANTTALAAIGPRKKIRKLGDVLEGGSSSPQVQATELNPRAGRGNAKFFVPISEAANCMNSIREQIGIFRPRSKYCNADVLVRIRDNPGLKNVSRKNQAQSLATAHFFPGSSKAWTQTGRFRVD